MYFWLSIGEIKEPEPITLYIFLELIEMEV
jgi:hypothetical protein